MSQVADPLKLHERHYPHEEARKDFLRFMIEWTQKHKLTTAETLEVLNREVQSIINSAIRTERS